MKNRSEKVVESREEWRKQTQMDKIRIVMTVVAVFLCISVAAGAVFAWLQVKGAAGPRSPGAAASSSASSKAETSAASDDSMNLVLVNSSNKLSSGYRTQLSSYGGVFVCTRIVPDLDKMMKAAQAAGAPLKLTGGYVGEAEQEKTYQAEVNRLMTSQKLSRVFAENRAQASVGRGGYSENQTGLAVMFSAEGQKSGQGFGTTAQYRWLVQNCVNYGFILRFPEDPSSSSAINSKTGCCFDPSHFRYVGAENALKMREFSMCLEEYVDYLSNQDAGN